ncbi:MAG: hypothetical protein OSJ31_00565 [Alistipes sp.]|nr:hypothetical protein [Alistipes sp.]
MPKRFETMNCCRANTQIQETSHRNGAGMYRFSVCVTGFVIFVSI